MEKMKGLVIETSGKIYVSEYDDPLYKTVGRTVGGYIELVHPSGLQRPYCMIVNEDGRYMDLQVNEIGSILYGYVVHGEPIMGDIVIMQEGIRNGEPDIVGLTEDDIHKLYQFLVGLGATV